MIKLETDLCSVQVTSKTGETASYVYADYIHGCPTPSWQPLRTNGSVAISFKPPLLHTPVEVSRETA